MLILVSTTTRYGKTLISSCLKYQIQAVVIEEPLPMDENNYKDFMKFCKEYSKTNNLIITDNGGFALTAPETFIDEFDVLIVGKLNDKTVAERLKQCHYNIQNLNKGEVILEKISQSINDDVFEKIKKSLSCIDFKYFLLDELEINDGILIQDNIENITVELKH